MARTIDEIFNGMLAAKAAEPNLSGLTSTSKVAIWRLLFYIVAVTIWTLETLFDIHIAETKLLLKKEKPGRPQWYAEKGKAFQYGAALVPDQDYYDNTGLDEAAIEAMKVVKYAVCIDLGNELRYKIAGLSGAELAPITAPQFAAFQAYVHQIKYGGVNISFRNSTADILMLAYKIYYDPLVLDATGKRLDGTNDTPIPDAINDYLTNDIEFNGFFVTSKLTDKLQNVPGVVVPTVLLAQSQYGLLPLSNIIDMVQPDSGYLRLPPGNLTLTFEPSHF